MSALIARLKAVAQCILVWRAENPDGAALVFDICVIAFGLLFVGVSTGLRDSTGGGSPATTFAPIENEELRCERRAAPSVSAVSTASLDAVETGQRTLRVLPISRAIAPSKEGWPKENHRRTVTYSEWRRHRTIPSPAAFFDAQSQLVTGQAEQAADVFTRLAATDPSNPATAYHLAVALHVAGRQDEATAAAVQAAALERRHGLPGYGWLMERIQGPHRVWLERIRRPILQQ